MKTLYVRDQRPNLGVFPLPDRYRYKMTKQKRALVPTPTKGKGGGKGGSGKTETIDLKDCPLELKMFPIPDSAPK